jgi:putative ABC transport system ATP-binding protein
MLIMRDIAKVYRTDTVETHALRQFSLTVGEGEFVSVTGPSGSGKTTFLNIAGLLEEYSSGTYELDGKDVSGLNDSERSRLRNEKIGFIFHLLVNRVSCLPMSRPATSIQTWPKASWTC